jgi:antitoxin component YwqK of YwqJK toxin-antitoxin module
MRKINNLVLIFLISLLAAGCAGRGSSKKEPVAGTETVTVPDTGYTGIKKYYSGNLLLKEVTFKNGVMNGEMKTYYKGGQLYQKYWYENGHREDSAKWYYLEGQVFRSTPMKHDTIDGTQIQYYRDGRVKAKLNYIKGLRTPTLEEYTRSGKLISGYPEIVYSINDDYNKTGKVRINLESSDKSKKAKFYHGEFTGGVFDTVKCTQIKSVNGKTFLDLKKSGTPQTDYVGIIAVFLTDFGNNYLAYKKIDLPYKDLK